MNKLGKKNKGFSLVELSVSLAIIGMIAGSAISVAINSDYNTKKSETEAKLNRIEESMAGFLQLNYRLPCPADGSTLVKDAGFGLEGTPTSTDCPNSNVSSGVIYSGVIPIVTLQLPKDFMFDGWGRRITYAIDLSFANNESTNGACDGDVADVCFIDDAAGSLTVNDASGAARNSDAVYVLVSHGENGHGAFIKNGSATRINAFPAGNPFRNDSPGEMENAEFDNSGADTAFDDIFIMKEYIREDDPADANREYFDDIVRYKTKSQLVKAAGALIYDTICRDSLSILNDPSSNSCISANQEGECIKFATAILFRCMP